MGPRLVTPLEPHSNLFHGAIAGIASILGGANSLSVFPEDGAQEMLCRIARNVSTILSEEAHLSKVADPTSGAYALDVMIDSIAEHAWSQFLKMLNA
jgi:methylmalonyl-CoA mutase